MNRNNLNWVRDDEGHFMSVLLNDGTIEFYSRLRTYLKPTDIVLDVGSGRGEWFYRDTNVTRRSIRNISDSVDKLIGIDLDDAVMSNPINTQNFLISNGKFPIADNSIDVVIADWVFEHVEDVEKFVSEINRCLKPGGFLAARTPLETSYPSLAAKVIQNKFHPKITNKAQKNRFEYDVFPTKYNLNSVKKIHQEFHNFECLSYIHVSEPSYDFGNKIIRRFLILLHQKGPKRLVGTLHIFLKKK
jgi:ubiquinone/menaquinone biosynthesis C-methylase UbiE